MKLFIKKFLYDWVLKWFRKNNTAKFRNMSTEQVFTEIYRSKHWKSTDNVSGPGSEINQTETLIRELNVCLRIEYFRIRYSMCIFTGSKVIYRKPIIWS